MLKAVPRRLVVLAGLSAVLACSRSRNATFYDASGTLAGMPEQIPKLDGRGVLIEHDGIYVGSQKVEPMRMPFELLDADIGDLKVGDRVVFKYRPLAGKGFPFAAKQIRRLTGPPPKPSPTEPPK